MSCCQDSAFLVVHGRLTAYWNDTFSEMSGGTGVVLEAGQTARVESDEGAIVIKVEAPQLVSTSRGRSTPDRILWQSWPGEKQRRKTLKMEMWRIYHRIRWRRPWLARLLLRLLLTEQRR
jgi:hypothetical protein